MFVKTAYAVLSVECNSNLLYVIGLQSGSAGFPLLSASHFTEFDTFVVSHMLFNRLISV